MDVEADRADEEGTAKIEGVAGNLKSEKKPTPGVYIRSMEVVVRERIEDDPCCRQHRFRGEGVWVWEGTDGKLGTTSEGFPQYNKLGSVRHVCELQDVMTS